MNPCQLTTSVTALANALSCCLSDEEAALMAAVLTQLGDTLATIVTQKELCRSRRETGDV